jgi:hypothetical protein
MSAPGSFSPARSSISSATSSAHGSTRSGVTVWKARLEIAVKHVDDAGDRTLVVFVDQAFRAVALFGAAFLAGL